MIETKALGELKVPKLWVAWQKQFNDISLDIGAPDETGDFDIVLISVTKYNLSLGVCSFGAAIGSEFLQFFLSGGKRSFDPKDMGFNFIGSIIGILLAFLHER